jgi:hypothetical protein
VSLPMPQSPNSNPPMPGGLSHGAAARNLACDLHVAFIAELLHVGM